MVISSVLFAQALNPSMNLSVLKLVDTGSACGFIWQAQNTGHRSQVQVTALLLNNLLDKLFSIVIRARKHF